jgi:NAD(P) transhydrogenase subunit beta
MSRSAEQLVYLVAAVLFIIGLQRLQSPATARSGNGVSGLGMLIAIIATLLVADIVSPTAIIAGLLVGSGIGYWMARTVKMTSMPQMVALLNGFGGAASLLVGGAEFLKSELRAEQIPIDTGITIQLSLLIGAITFTGSMIAWAKLQEVMTGKPIVFPGQKTLSGLLFLSVIAMSTYQLMTPESLLWPFYGVVAVSLLLGVLLVIPIGGADMPVVISLLNSYSGIAAAMTGFVIDNSVLIISGALVGSSGIILSQIMCKAMNRSLANVLMGNIGEASGGPSADDVYGGKVKAASADDIAIVMDGARRVVIVPGYGLAVSQAQHAVRDLVNLLESRGAEVEFAIHPVAGRMPGHMNVLLAEADIAYDKLKEMDEINPTFQQTDVAIVIGANDVVNPLARTDPQSPIAGMPILDVDKARTVVVIKRSLSPGFAGIPNPLFAADNTLMYFADGKKAIVDLIAALKAA